MKLLLTSAGIKNKSISKAIEDLIGLPAKDIKVVFVPTAANVEGGDKDWLINDYVQFKAQGYASIDIIDIAAVSKEISLPRLEAANLICFGGGNEQFLAKILRESGVGEALPELLKTRIYMGISAGAMVAGQFLAPELLNIIYPEDAFDGPIERALDLAHVNIIPHLNSPWFPKVRTEVLESLPSQSVPIYALDDESALKIIDGNMEVVTECQFLKI